MEATIFHENLLGDFSNYNARAKSFTLVVSFIKGCVSCDILDFICALYIVRKGLLYLFINFSGNECLSCSANDI